MNGTWLGIVGVVSGFVAASVGMGTAVVSMKKAVIFMLCLWAVAFMVGLLGWDIEAGVGLTLGSAMSFFMGVVTAWIMKRTAC